MSNNIRVSPLDFEFFKSHFNLICVDPLIPPCTFCSGLEISKVDAGVGSGHDGFVAGDDGRSPAHPGESQSAFPSSPPADHRSPQSHWLPRPAQHPPILCRTQSRPVHLPMDERPLRRRRYIYNQLHLLTKWFPVQIITTPSHISCHKDRSDSG